MNDAAKLIAADDRLGGVRHRTTFGLSRGARRLEGLGSIDEGVVGLGRDAERLVGENFVDGEGLPDQRLGVAVVAVCGCETKRRGSQHPVQRRLVRAVLGGVG